jgi:hypothetical protein
MNATGAFALALLVAAAADDTASYIRLEAGDDARWWVIADNGRLGEHRAGYNGVIRIDYPDGPQHPFVPAYAGLNLEHYFDARPRHEAAEVFFEPRHAPMDMRQLHGRLVELYQAPTPHYGVESWTQFQTYESEPNVIHMTFRCKPTKRAFKTFMGVFWASYINDPEDKAIYFLGEGSSLDAPRWERFETEQHGKNSTVLPEDDENPFKYPEGGNTLFNSFSELRYAEPFFYGRRGDDVLIYIFDPNPYLRFAHSPSGGGRNADGTGLNPAWDFQLVIPDWKPGEEYGLSMRLIVKPWQSQDDVLAEVRRFQDR